MAEIAVEKKGGMAWLLWLLIAIALIVFLWWFFAGRNSNAQATGDRGRAVETASGPIRNPATIYAASDPQALVGRKVELQNARVLSVTGDNIFWVGEGEGKQVLVFLDEKATPGQPRTEGRYDVTPGQSVNVYGETERFPGWETAQSQWHADQSLRSNFEAQKVYVHANRLEIQTRP